MSSIMTECSLHFGFSPSKCWVNLVRKKLKVALFVIPKFTVNINWPVLERAVMMFTPLSFFEFVT